MDKLGRKTIEILVGIILGDGHLGKSGNKFFITLEQTSKHQDYVKYLHNYLIKNGVNIYPIKYYTRLDSRYNIINKSVYFKTHNLISLKKLGFMFLSEKGVKKIPLNIKHWLTPVSLAHWICGDGQLVKGGGITLCTDSYSLEEVKLLINALIEKFNIKCSIHNKKGRQGKVYHRIYIFKHSFNAIKPLLIKHVYKSFLYKLHI